MKKKTAYEVLLEKQDKWTIIKKEHTGFIVECKKCGLVQGLSKYLILKDNDECCCSSEKIKSVAKKQAQAIYAYMIKDITEYGLLEGEELNDYIRDIVRIDNYLMSFNQVFIDAVILEVQELYKERKVQRCVNCGKLYPASRLYKKTCLKRYKDHCVA